RRAARRPHLRPAVPVRRSVPDAGHHAARLQPDPEGAPASALKVGRASVEVLARDLPPAASRNPRSTVEPDERCPASRRACTARRTVQSRVSEPPRRSWGRAGVTAQAAQAVRGRAGAGLIVFICFLIAAVEGYDIQAFGVAAPRLIPDLGLDPSRQGWAASAAMIGLVLGAFVGGWAADRMGRKPVLLASVLTFGAFSVATALSQGYEGLLWARFLTGLGFGGAMPNLIAVASEISPPQRRAATVTMMFCGMPAGGASVALLARLLGDELSWRTLFMVGGVLPLVL